MYTFDSKVRYSETDSEGKLTIGALLNYFQDSCTFQSEEIGLGVEYAEREHHAWVLSAWQIVVDRYPKLCEEVTVGTFPYDFKGFLGSRNFVLMTGDGTCLAKANSLWTLLSTDTGRPQMPSEKMLASYPLEEKLDMDYAPRKIAIAEGGETKEILVVKKHHLDTNHHVNNVQYVNMAMEYLPEHFVVTQMRAEYKMQAFLDDVLIPYVVSIAGGYVISFSNEAGKPYVIVEFLGKEL